MRFTLKAALAVALPMILAACSSTSSPRSPSSAGATAASASLSPANPNAGLLTGTEMKALLAPASYFPRGFTLDPGGSVNTGDGYQQPSPGGHVSCDRLDATSWVELSGIGAVSFAQNDFINKNTSEEYAQEIDAYQGDGAKAAMAALREVATRCPSFADSQTSSTVTVKLGKGPAIGDDSLAFFLTSPRWRGGTTLEAIRVGAVVVTVLCSSDSDSGTTQASRLGGLIAGKVIQKTQPAS